MAAMQGWVEKRQADPGGLDPAAVDEFSVWVRDRAEVSSNTATLPSDSERGW